MFRRNYIVLIIIIIFLSSCAKEKVIYIGLVGTERGEDNYAGIEAYKSINIGLYKLKKKDFKPTGKRKVELLHYDDENDPEKALLQIQKLISEDRVCAVILSNNIGSLSEKAIEIAEKNKVPIISIAGNFEPSNNQKYIFEYSPNNAKYVEKAFERLNNDLLLKKCCFVKYQSEEVIGLLKEPEVPDYLSKYVETPLRLTLTPNNLLDIVLTIKSNKEIDSILFDGPVDEIIKFNGKCLEKGLFKPIIYIKMMDKSNFTKKELNMLKGLYFFSPIAEDTENPYLLTFIQSYYENSGENPSITATLAYEALSTIINAIKNTDTYDRNIIANKIISSKHIIGVIAHIPRKENDRYKIYIQKVIPIDDVCHLKIIGQVE
ncbi:MAG: ABC transporter substrate-binding protein [bacterium]